MKDEMADPIAGILGAVFVRRLCLRHGGLSQVEKVVGVSRRTLWKIEKGLSTPGPKVLTRLGEPLGIPRGQLERLRRLLDAQRLAEAGGLGNALRVCNDLTPARAAFARARKLRDAFSPSDPPLHESRLPDREASLCREERRFPEAVALHDEAFRLSPVERRGSILLNKAATLEQMEAFERALATLQEAEPNILAAGTLRDLCILRFNTAVCLCNLGRAGEAGKLVPEI